VAKPGRFSPFISRVGLIAPEGGFDDYAIAFFLLYFPASTFGDFFFNFIFGRPAKKRLLVSRIVFAAPEPPAGKFINDRSLVLVATGGPQNSPLVRPAKKRGGAPKKTDELPAGRLQNQKTGARRQPGRGGPEKIFFGL
jgi:hypothetical protein